MKKINILTIAFALVAMFSTAQQVQREKVVMEIGTTFVVHPNTASAARGVTDMINNSHRVAVVEYHNSWQGANPYTTVDGLARITWYSMGTNPVTKFDGVVTANGGYPVPQSLYPIYLTKYNERQGLLSDFTIQKTITNNGGLNYTANITINKVGTPASTNMKLMVVLTESHKAHDWGSGLTEVNHIFRIAPSTINGTTVNFGAGNQLIFNLPFAVDATWVLANLELVVFVQDFTTKEVLQGTYGAFNTILGVQEAVKTNFNLNIYPNPMNNTAMIAFDLKESANAMVEVYDIVGKNVYSNNLGTVPAGVNTVDFDGSMLDAGMYIVKLAVNNQVTTQKITINK